jgi:hypothetical protein
MWVQIQAGFWLWEDVESLLSASTYSLNINLGIAEGQQEKCWRFRKEKKTWDIPLENGRLGMIREI